MTQLVMVSTTTRRHQMVASAPSPPTHTPSVHHQFGSSQRGLVCAHRVAKGDLRNSSPNISADGDGETRRPSLKLTMSTVRSSAALKQQVRRTSAPIPERDSSSADVRAVSRPYNSFRDRVM